MILIFLNLTYPYDLLSKEGLILTMGGIVSVSDLEASLILRSDHNNFCSFID